MAKALRCKHCGYQQGTHDIDPQEFPEKLPGYRLDIMDCPGFQPTNTDQEKIEADDQHEKRRLEREPTEHFVPLLTPAGVIDIGS